MTQPITLPTVHAALSRVMADVQAVGKGDRNNEQHYNFRGIDAVVNAVGPKLREHGVLVVPELLESSWRDVRTSRDKPARECTVKVRFRFYGPAGDFIDATTPGESMDFGDKGAAKAMSVAFRIALLQALCIPTHEPDPDASSYERDYDRGPSPTARALFERITEAPSADELRACWQEVNAAGGNGSISGPEAGQLKAHIKRRIEEFAAVGDAEHPGDKPLDHRSEDWPEPASIPEDHA